MGPTINASCHRRVCVAPDHRLESAINLPVPGSNFINPTLMVFVVISLVLVAGVIEFSDIVAAAAAIDR
jgi:hypothetical protein